MLVVRQHPLGQRRRDPESFVVKGVPAVRSLRDRFGLSPKAKIKTLSKGQARQVALLCAVAHRPELLLLDEPAGGLDPSVRREFLETSIQLLNDAGSTILFSSHYMTDVERMATRQPSA